MDCRKLRQRLPPDTTSGSQRVERRQVLAGGTMN